MKVEKQWLEQIKHHLNYDATTGLFVRKGKRKNLAGSVNAGGYVQIRFQGKLYYAHRLAWLFINGMWPDNVINHKNGHKLDNRIENLEDVEQHINLSLRHKVAGVRVRNGKFYARVLKNKKEFQEGPFDCANKAHEAYFKLREKVLNEVN